VISRRQCTHKRRGFGYLELLVAVLLLVMSAAGALAVWSFSTRAAASTRTRQMTAHLGVRELERLKARTYAGLPETDGQTVGSVTNPQFLETHYNAAATVVTASDPARRYFARARVITLDSNGDGRRDTQDLRELTVEVFIRGESAPHTRMRTLLSFGGL
jgi:type II secretory pathway pseudopilin PulG